MNTEIARNDFSFNVSALGYTLYYKGEPVCSAALPIEKRTKENLSGRNARRNRRVFGEAAEKLVCSCVSGSGPEGVMAAIKRIQAEHQCKNKEHS